MAPKDPMSAWDTFLDQYGLLAVFALLYGKATGIPVPIPADVLLLGTAAQAATGKVSLGVAFGVVLLALVLGGLSQFGLARGPGRQVLYQFGKYLGLTPGRLESAAATARQRGPLGIATAMLVPGVRSVAVAACGVADVPLTRFLPGLLLGSGLDVALHFALGYLGGAFFASLRLTVPAPSLLVAVGGLLALGLTLWLIIRRRRRAGGKDEVVAAALAAWSQGTCPVCLALGAMDSSGHLPEVPGERK
jgi:membrane protein DedA with SNARE-associated domain